MFLPIGHAEWNCVSCVVISGHGLGTDESVLCPGVQLQFGPLHSIDCSRVIPCQINKQNAFTFQISTKLGRLVPSGKLLNHTYFGCVKLYGFGVISHSFFQHFGHLAPRS